MFWRQAHGQLDALGGGILALALKLLSDGKQGQDKVAVVLGFVAHIIVNAFEIRNSPILKTGGTAARSKEELLLLSCVNYWAVGGW